jgi:acyl-CoA synthetase (NDP forming)
MSTAESPDPTSSRTLSERDSKALLLEYGVPIAAERVVATAPEARAAADELGYPVVVKLNGDAIAHKTERGLVRLGLPDAGALAAAIADLLDQPGCEAVLIAPMVRGAARRRIARRR